MDKISSLKKEIIDTLDFNKATDIVSIDLLNYLKKKFTHAELYLIIGADNLISFHKWKDWKNISKKCHILVFDRYPYKSKALKSLAFKEIDKKKLEFINFRKVNISSSQLRKI